ncbi:MAG: sulfonate transport system permease protein [Methanoregula sp. SKADARSKE-2]|nr:MAG: sulfonate transport system permease protein [Methanoregula sp. SKADARSKE-2]
MNRSSFRHAIPSRSLLKILLPVAIIVGWEVAAILLNKTFILPRLETVFAVLLNPFSGELTFGSGSLFDNAIISLERVIAGFLAAAGLAIPLGVGMGRSEIVHDLFDSLMQLLRPIPPLAWVPLTLAWFKIGLVSMIFIIGMGAFFPILLNTLDGVKGVKKTWIEAAQILGAKERQILSRVILPGAAPTIWTGLRVGFGIAWMCVVAAEMMPGTNSGLGYLIISSYNFGQVPVIIAGMIVIGIIGIGCDYLFKLVDSHSFAWRELER